MNQTRFILLTMCFISILGVSKAKAAEIVVFGDSMSSVGSNGHFSNGPVWTDYLADHLGLQRPIASNDGGHNYAFGGSKSAQDGGNPSIRTQIEMFLSENAPQDDQLFFIWGGGNDYFSNLDQDLTSQNMESNFQTLLNAGAKHLVTGGLPGTNDWISGFNADLENDAAELEQAHDVSLPVVDVSGILQQVDADPVSFGFTEPQENAKGNSSSGDGYVWWTHGHWTTQYHEFMSEHVAQALGFSPNTRHVSGWRTIARDRTWDDVGLAHTSTAEQSSDAHRSVAGNAIDGDLDTKATTHRSSTEHWWEMKLAEPELLEGLEIRNAEASGKSLTDFGGFRAEISDTDGNVAWSQDFIGDELPHGLLEAEILTPDGRIMGKSLRLSKLPPVEEGRRGVFSISEVELYTNASSLTLRPEETWAFDIDATQGRTDVLAVAGALDLGGSNLLVTLLDGELEAGDVFDVIDAATITGSFSDLSLPTLPPPLQWHTSALGDDGTIAVTIRGDYDNSGSLDATDIDLLSSHIRDAGINIVFDLSGDGAIDETDHLHWVEQFAGTFLGDADLDGTVQFPDFLALSNHFGQQGGWSQGDFDGNGTVEFPDFLALATNFGESTTVAAAVPEPTAACLAMFGILGLISLNGSRRKK